ncbi:MAG: hypothetical protein RLZZ214_2641 [Verrucomicrobiota bacterium]
MSNGTVGAPQLRLDGSSDPIELPASISYLTSNDTNGAIVNEAGSNTLAGPITLASGGGSTRIYSNADTLTLSGPITTNTTGRTLKLMGAGNGSVTGNISDGSTSNVLTLSKEETGTWTLAGHNTHGGTTTVAAGTLVIAHPKALGTGGMTLGNNTSGTSITSGAVLDLNSQQDIHEVITVRGTGIGSGGALINSSTTTAASIASGMVSSISTSTGGVHSTVPDVILTGNATAVATLGLSVASFTLNSGTTVYSAAPTVTISGGGGSGATANAVLSGGVVSSITLTNTGTGYTTAPTIAFGGGTISTAGTNPTGTGNATHFIVAGVRVTHPGSGYTSPPGMTFGSGSGTAATANLSTLILGANSQIGGAGDIIINPGISGGSNTLTKVGAGNVTLNGANTHTGSTTINGGRLILTGSIAGALTTNNGSTFAPQGAPLLAGALTHFSSSILQVRLNGSTAGTGYDQLNAGGNVTLAGTLDPVCGPNLPPGSTFTILNKTSTGAISGTFAGIANNSTFAADGYTFQVSYTGGTGNDIVLTLITTPIEQWRFTRFGSILASGPGLDTADPDGDGTTNLMEYATNMNPAASDVVPQFLEKTGSVLDFVYTRNKSATDVTCTVEWSDTLNNDWSTSNVIQSLVPNSDNGVTQQFKATLPAGPNAQRFVRLRVTRP